MNNYRHRNTQEEIEIEREREAGHGRDKWGGTSLIGGNET